MPNEKSKAKIEFKRHNRMIKVPFVVFADFEPIVKPINSIEPSIENRLYQTPVSCGFSYKIVCFDDKIWSQDPLLYERKIRRNLKIGKLLDLRSLIAERRSQ